MGMGKDRKIGGLHGALICLMAPMRGVAESTAGTGGRKVDYTTLNNVNSV